MKFTLILVFNLLLCSITYSQDSLSVLFKTNYQDLNIYLFEKQDGVFQFIQGGNRSKYLVENPAILYSDSAYITSISVLNRNNQSRKNMPVLSDSTVLLIPVSNIFRHQGNDYILMNPIEKNKLSPISDLSQSSILYLYRIDSTQYSFVNSLSLAFPYTTSNMLILPNLNNNFTGIFNLRDSTSGFINYWRLVEFDPNAQVVFVSDSIKTSTSAKKLVQSSTDSSYSVFEIDLKSYIKIDKNLSNNQTILTYYPQEKGHFTTSYQIPEILDTVYSFVHFRPDTSFDSSFIGTVHIESDSIIKWDTKKYVPNNWDVSMGFFNFSLENSKYTYAYTTPECQAIWCQPNCINQVVVENFDLSGNLLWSKTMGGDASYMIGGVLNTKDGGVLGTVIRYDTTQNAFGDFDAYYFYIDSNGQLIHEYLPLGLLSSFPDQAIEKLSLFPNPTTSELTLENKKIQNLAKEIIIYDVAGSVIIKMPFSKTINVSNLIPGNYIYSLVLEKDEVINQIFTKY